MVRACVVQRLHFNTLGGNYMIRPRRWLSATESRSSSCFSWRVFLLLLLASNSDPLCFSAYSGSNLLPEPGMILDEGSLIAMVVKEVVVISGPLFGGVMAIVQLVSVTAGGTQKGMTIV